jgi:hypothetical protein
MPNIKIVAYYRANQKYFFSKKAYSTLLQRHLLFIKSKDNFLLKTFIQHREQEHDKSILNYQPKEQKPG